MYVIVEYLTCVALIGGFLALVFAGWLLLLATHEGVKRLAKREGTPEPQFVELPKENFAPKPTATLTDVSPFMPMQLGAKHESSSARSALPPPP